MQSNWAKMLAKNGGAGAAAAPAGHAKPKSKSKKRKRHQKGGGGGSGGSGFGSGGGGAPQPQRQRLEAPGGPPSAAGLRPGAPTRPYVPPSGMGPVPAALLEPGMRHFDACLAQCYRGFVHQPAALSALEPRVLAALEQLKARGYFHYDVVFNGGVNLGRTFVRRILVGVPGITYKYLGLRIFAHPWSTDAGATPEMLTIRAANDALTASTGRLLAAGKAVGKGGRCDYNLTLINLMEDEDDRGPSLRNKAGTNLGGGQIAVSWHADSSLEDFSSIAVLNLTIPSRGKGRGKRPKGGGQGPVSTSFKIAMKCVGEGHEPRRGEGGGTPALAQPLSNGDAYYMLCVPPCLFAACPPQR